MFYFILFHTHFLHKLPVQSNVTQYSSSATNSTFTKFVIFFVFVDKSVRKEIILLYVYYRGRSGWWCCTGVHYIDRWF